MLVNHTKLGNKFCFSYPNINCDKSIILSTENVLGVFQNLSQVIGIGMNKTNREDINTLFDWSNGELNELDLLSD